MITDDDWAAFEADMTRVDNRPPVVENTNYADWANYEHVELGTYYPDAPITTLGRIE